MVKDGVFDCYTCNHIVEVLILVFVCLTFLNGRNLPHGIEGGFLIV